MTHPLKCACGALTGSVDREHLSSHSICYCQDCQAFARFLRREADLLDAAGGFEVIQVLPKDVRFHDGVQRLACMRLSASGLFRWYAACCNTPIGNTPATSKIPFVGLARACLGSPGPTVDQSFGPIRFCAFTSGARCMPKSKPFGMPGFALWLVRNRLRARFTGGFRYNPFFDTTVDLPVVDPRVLLPTERDELDQSERSK
jgi:hypothetical protein